MPRKPTQKHPIRDLRAIIGKTQNAFAQTIGINPGTLKRIENNDSKLRLTPRIARLIRLEAGVDDKQLLAGRLCSVWGHKYTKECYQLWKGDTVRRGDQRIKIMGYFDQDERIAKIEAQRLAAWIDILFRAAAVGSKRVLWPVSEVLVDAINECRINFNLTAPTNAILNRYVPGLRWHPQGGGDMLLRAWQQKNIQEAASD